MSLFLIGAFTFSGYINSQDIDESGPTYAKLAQSVDENLLKASVEVSGGRQESKVDKVLHKLLQSGDSAQKYMQGSRSKRIDNWILLDNYVQGRGVSTSSRARALQIHSKRSKKNMSMKQQKKKGLFDFPKDFHSFDEFKSMHEMWKGYIMQLLKSTGMIKSEVIERLIQTFNYSDVLGTTLVLIKLCPERKHFLETGCFRVKTVVAMFREHYFQSNYEYEQAQLFEVAMNQIPGPNDIPLFHQDMVDPLGGWLV
ncbi:hypothetical protein C1H46_001271 [Malus baccata]|uniref:Uncharacterized protein n=1 Tax=Malus baccata TaxID=106549 RepID=A0A540NQ69_MALBA|nr:hypothetical protein C1H46_001271 [Malus baccata]